MTLFTMTGSVIFEIFLNCVCYSLAGVAVLILSGRCCNN
jgi:hypothetical protein